jgi:hypothetical protein
MPTKRTTPAINASGGDPLQATQTIVIFDKFCNAEFEADVKARAAKHGADALVAVFQAITAAEGPGTTGELVLNVVVDVPPFVKIMHNAGLATLTAVDANPIDPFTGLTRPGDLLSGLAAGPYALANRRYSTRCSLNKLPPDSITAELTPYSASRWHRSRWHRNHWSSRLACGDVQSIDQATPRRRCAIR